MAPDEPPTRILLVDDEEFAAAAAAILERERDEFVVDAESDPVGVLDRVRTGSVDCVVSEYELPGTDGLEFLASVRAEQPGLPFFLYTDVGSEEIAAEAIAAGVTDYLRKGSDADRSPVLANRIADAVSRYRVERVESRYRTLVEESIDAVSVVDADGTVSYVSPASERIFGYSPEEVVGDDASEYVHPDDRPGVEERFAEFIDEPGGRMNVEFRARDRGGSWVALEVHARNLVDDPRVEGIVLYASDVTGRQRRERALESLHDATRELMAAETREEILEAGIDAAETILELDIATFHVERDDVLVPAAATERSRAILGELPRLERGSSIAWDVFETGDGEVTGDVRADTRIRNPETEIRSEMILPLGDHGVFLASSLEVDAFDEVDGSLAKVLASNVEAALDRSAREALLRERERALGALHSATRDLMASESSEEVLDVGIDAAESLLGFDIASINLVEEEGLVPAAVTERIDDYPAELLPFEEGASVAWTAFESGDPVVVDDVRQHPDVSNPATGIRSEMILPLGDHGVFLASSLEVGAFDEVDESLAKVLASNVEAALDRAARETLLRKREQTLESLHGATRALMTAERTEEAADVIAETAREVLDLPLAGVWLYDEAQNALVPVAYPVEGPVPDEAPTFRPGDSLAWEAFDAGTTLSYDENDLESRAHNPDTPIRSEIVIPLGAHGVLVSGSTLPRTFTDSERHLAEILATAARAALDRVERDEERADQRRELERQNERLEEFAGVVSHDLRNPLNVALGNLQLLEEETDDARVRTILDALERMDELIEDVLAMARQGQAVIEPEPVALAEVVRSAWETAGDEGAALRIDGELGEIRGDRGRLQQLLENLFRNSVEHSSTSPRSTSSHEDAVEHGSTSPDSPARRDAAGARSGEGVTVHVGEVDAGFYVEDDGPGIPPDVRETVLESGYSTADGGSGFGLAIVVQIVDAHGWDVRVTEGEAGGARFEITGVSRS